MNNVSDKADMFRQMQEQNRRFPTAEPELPLKHGGGGGTSDGMQPTMKDYVDAKDAQNLAEMKSEFEKLRGDIAKLPTTWTMIGTAASIVGILLAALAFGGTRFSAGISLADMRQAQLARDSEQDFSVRQINEKLDQLIAAEQVKQEATTSKSTSKAGN